MISFFEFVSIGREQWRGQQSLIKALFFLIFGSPDTHTRLRNSYMLTKIALLDFPRKCKVFEGGFGRAGTLFWLARHHPDWEITGVELDPVMATSAQCAAEKGGFRNLHIIEGSSEDLLEEQIYDLMISSDILEHLDDDIGYLQRHYQALKPGGYLLLHVPQRHQNLWRWIPAFRHHGVYDFVRDKDSIKGIQQVHVHGHVRDEYTIDEIREVVNKVGFKVWDIRETVGKLGEISFELNQLFWSYPFIRYIFSILTYPLAVFIGYLDVLRNPSKGSGILITAIRE